MLKFASLYLTRWVVRCVARAIAAGIDGDAIEDARDEEDPKTALITLLATIM